MTRAGAICGAAFVLAALVAIASLGGILVPATYARETASWRAQGIGQDWFDLVVIVPVLVACGIALARGARGAMVPFAGVLIFTLYTFVIYAFAVHFNSFFLVYCAALAVSFFTLLAVAIEVTDADSRAQIRPRAPMRLLGGVLIGTGVLFYLMWIAEVVPAVVRGTAPSSLDEVGLLTNPVHVLDMSIVLPATIAAGVSALRGRRIGLVLGPPLLAFSGLMLLSIAELFVVMKLRGLPSSLILACVLTMGAIGSGVLLSRIVRLRVSRPVPTVKARAYS